MNRLIGKTTSLALAAGLFVAVPGASPASAQELGAGERITIMVPDLAPLNGANDNFGEDLAEDIRKLIDELRFHQTVSGRDIRRARREFDLDHEDLYNCISARQLAMQKNWGLVMCGSYEEVGDRQVHVTASFVGSRDGQTFDVPEFTISEREHEQAAQRILETFDQWQTMIRHTVFCQQYMDSQQWGEALRNCNTALEINPNYESALYKKAFTLRELDRLAESLETLDTLLELNPIHQDALKLAGIVATTLEQSDRAREYFDRYMELNPGDVAVRLTIARDISNAGDPAAALRFAQEGLEVEPDNLTLITYIGHFAANAANQAERALNNQEVSPDGTVDPSMVSEYYQTAAEYYEQVFDQQGAETDPQILERLIVALFKLQRYDEAMDLGSRAIAARPDNADLWEAHSRALQEAGQEAFEQSGATGMLEEALAAVERAQELGKDSPALTQRKGQLQLKLGQDDAAVATIIGGVEAGHFRPTDAFRTLFIHAYQEEFQRGNLDDAFALLEAAAPVAEAREDVLARNFWRGYILFQQAQAIHAPATAESAREALPVFERALELFRAAQGYEEVHASADVPKFIDNTQRFIEIEEALIERGR